MNYYRAERTNTLTGIYKGYHNGYYLFELNNGVKIDFEQLNKNILEEFDLKSDKHTHKIFIVEFKEIFDDLDDEDFIIFRLEGLQLL